jgi:hypothetical protein
LADLFIYLFSIPEIHQSGCRTCLCGRIIVKIDLKNNLEVKQVGSGGKGQNNSVDGKIVMTY